MRSILIFLAVTFTGSAMAQAVQPDPCQLVGALPAQQMISKFSATSTLQTSEFNAANILLGLLLPRERRLKVVCEIKASVLEKYSLIELKKERMNIDVDQHLQDCAREELTITNNDRQDFLDRVQKCIAGLQDTHFSASPRVPRPVVMAPMTAVLIGGKILIGKQSPLLIARIKAGDPDTWKDLETTLAPGNEITMIDGVPATDAVATLVPYIGASSPAFAQYYAAVTFFSRDYLYPKTRTVTLEIKTASGEVKHLALPWMAQVTPGNFDAQMKFKALGLPLVNEMQWKYNPVLRKMEKNDDALFSVGFTLRNPLFADKATLTTYLDDDGAPGLRTGEVIQDSKHVFCYMQLLTFMSKEFVKDGTTDKQGFFDPIRKFVASCEAKQMPLILDLKNNGGGNGSYPAKLLSILTEKGAKYGSDVQAFPMTSSMIDIATSDMDPDASEASDLDGGADQETLLSAISDAVQNGAKYSDILNGADVTADKEVGGYSQKVVAIVTPFCISACDMTSRLLKNSKRAVIVGTAGNGTGAGFWSSSKLNSAFTDSEGLLSFEIPNFLFGVDTKAGDPDRLPIDANKNLLMENVPTMADVVVPFSQADVASAGKDISAAALAELYK